MLHGDRGAYSTVPVKVKMAFMAYESRKTGLELDTARSNSRLSDNRLSLCILQ